MVRSLDWNNLKFFIDFLKALLTYCYLRFMFKYPTAPIHGSIFLTSHLDELCVPLAVQWRTPSSGWILPVQIQPIKIMSSQVAASMTYKLPSGCSSGYNLAKCGRTLIPAADREQGFQVWVNVLEVLYTNICIWNNREWHCYRDHNNAQVQITNDYLPSNVANKHDLRLWRLLQLPAWK